MSTSHNADSVACPKCEGMGTYSHLDSLRLRGIPYRGEVVPDILLICQTCKGTGEVSDG